jgi:hypothetical protein
MSKRVYLVVVVITSLGAVFFGSTIPAAGAYVGTFLSKPRQSAPLRVSGTNVVVANKAWVGFAGKTCLTVHDAHNVYIHDVDFDGCAGDVWLVNVTGSVRIENVRARNTGAGRTTNGSGQGEVIQLSNVWQSAPERPDGAARIRMIQSYGGNTEDAISIYKSGGVDAKHPLVIGSVHIEDPVSGALAWSSSSGTCINLADGGGHDIRLQNSTFMNCGSVGIQMNEPGRNVKALKNVVYGAARSASNVGLAQWSAVACPSSCPGNAYTANRVWWVKSDGTAAPIWLSRKYPVADVSNLKQVKPITLAELRVAL